MANSMSDQSLSQLLCPQSSNSVASPPSTTSDGHCKETPPVAAPDSDNHDVSDVPALFVSNGQFSTTNSPRDKTPNVKKIVNFVYEAGVDVFRDQYGTVYAYGMTPDSGYPACMELDSDDFMNFLLVLIESHKMAWPTMPVLKSAVDILQMHALRQPQRTLCNRFANQGDDTVVIDTADSQNTVIVATKDGWHVKFQSEPQFWRPPHQRPMPRPISGGNVTDLFNYVPVDTDTDRLVILTWIIAAMMPVIVKPILLLTGQQGSAKTTRSRRIKTLLDPSITPVLGKLSDPVLTLTHHAVMCLENVASFSRQQTDTLCRAVTGDGVERRKLFTDRRTVLYSYRCALIINGLESPSTRPDFLDRCVTIHCQRLDNFLPQQDLDREFEAATPRLLGALLDLLVKVLGTYANIPTANTFRMADFARLGRAVASALGKNYNDFDDAYRIVIQQQNTEIVDDNPITRLLKHFANRYAATAPWQGSAEELLTQLLRLCTDHRDDIARHDLPRSPRWLSSKLNELAPVLHGQGITIERLPRTSAVRPWCIFTATPLVADSDVAAIRSTLEGGESHE